MPVDTLAFGERIRNWDEEWLSQLLEEALRLKTVSEHKHASCDSSARA